MDPYSFLNTAHTAYFAELYDQYLIDPKQVEPSSARFIKRHQEVIEYFFDKTKNNMY
jgi:2-oxoglutarate dehydrogenase E1 component